MHRVRGWGSVAECEACDWLAAPEATPTFGPVVLLPGTLPPLPPAPLQDLQPVGLLQLQDSQGDLIPVGGTCEHRCIVGTQLNNNKHWLSHSLWVSQVDSGRGQRRHSTGEVS